MTEPLSVAASVAGLVAISKEMFCLCRDYYSGVKDAKKDIERFGREIAAFDDVQKKVQELVHGPSEALVGLFETCSAELNDLKRDLAPGKGWKSMGLRAW